MIDATALGSGRGGDETYVRSVLRGLAATAAPDDEFEFLHRRGADSVTELEAAFGGATTWTALARPGPERLLTTVPRIWRSGRARKAVAYTHAPVPASLPHALVVTDLSFRHAPEYYPRAARLRLNALVPIQARRAAVVITLSEFCRADLIESYSLEPDRVHVVPCAIDPPIAGRADGDDVESWLRAHGVDRPFVLYLGNLHPRKNVARLIRAFRQLSAAARGEVQLVVAGASWWGGGGEEEAAAGCPPQSVVFVGAVTDEQRTELLDRALVLAYPSLFEGFGLPPLEAMQARTPVLTSSTTAIPETVGSAALLVDPLDEASIADGLRRLVESRGLRDEFVRLGTERVEQFTVERTGRAVRRALAAVPSN